MNWGRKTPKAKRDLREWRPFFAWHPVDVTDRYPDGMFRDDEAPAKWVWMETVERRWVAGSMWPFPVHRPIGEDRSHYD